MTLPDPWRYPRPETAEHYIGLLADAPRRPLAISGRRQVGKTHFLTHDLVEQADRKGWEPVYVDLWGQTDPLGAVNTAFATLLRRLQASRGVATEAAATPQAEDPAALMAVRFAELLRLQPDRPMLLLLDEAQALARPGAGELAMKALRALFNSHPGATLLVFTSSSKPQLMSLVGDHSQTAFKLAAHIDFPLLGKAFCAHVAERYHTITQREAAQADIEWAFGQLLHRPGQMIDFVRFMITDATGLDVRGALAAFKEHNASDAGLRQQFAGCTPVQQAVLLQVAAGQRLFSRDTRAQVARLVGQAQAVAPASVHNALQQLEDKGVLVKSPQRGVYGFEDEQFRDWIDQVARGAVQQGL